MSNTPSEIFQNIVKTGISLFIKDKEKAENATPQELHQAMIEANEDFKVEVINTFAQSLTELVQAEAIKLNEAYSAQLKTETDLVVGELRTEVANLTQQLKDLNVDAKIEASEKKIGKEILEFTSKEKGTPLGDGKTIETHVEVPKAAPPIKHFGQKIATA